MLNDPPKHLDGARVMQVADLTRSQPTGKTRHETIAAAIQQANFEFGLLSFREV